MEFSVHKELSMSRMNHNILLHKVSLLARFYPQQDYIDCE